MEECQPQGKAVPVVIDLQGVSLQCQDHMLLENVNLQVHEREMIGIIGPNGGGKTTLLRLILGALLPSCGTVQVFGKPPAAVVKDVGYVPQHLSFDHRYPVTVLDVVLMGCLAQVGWGPFRKKEHQMAEAALDAVEMLPYRDRAFAQLSGGQRQRVLIGRALVGTPKLLLFDEPTANVDSCAGVKIYRLLEALSQQMTILMVSHDISFVSQQITSVVCVNKKVQIHPTSQLDGQVLRDLYGSDMALVRHDHRCSEEGHAWLN